MFQQFSFQRGIKYIQSTRKKLNTTWNPFILCDSYIFWFIGEKRYHKEELNKKKT